MFFLLSKVVSTSVGFLFPVYSSYKAIRANEQEAIESWLMYWVVMAGLHAVENTVEWTVNWFPFYYEAKTCVIIWLTVPQIQGSTYVYATYIHPFLLKHEAEIDKTVAQTRESAKSAGLDYMRRAYVYLREALMKAILSPEGQQATAAPGSGAPGQQAPTNDAAPHQPHAPPGSPAQQAWQFAGSLLRSYGPAAVAAGSSVLKPLRNVNTASLHANVPMDDVARRKKYDDLGVAGPDSRPPRDRLYSQEVRGGFSGAQGSAGPGTLDRRFHSASAALLGATGGAASGSAYSTYTRAQLRQRRIELERELAALETTSDAPSDADSVAALPAGVSSLRGSVSASGTPSTVRERERHNSAPNMSFPPSHQQLPRRSPAGTPPYMEASTTFEQIGRDEAIDQAHLPNDWGKNVDRRGWRGAPPVTHMSGPVPGQPFTAQPPGTAERPPNPKRTSWSFWGGSSNAPNEHASDQVSSATDRKKSA